MGYVNVENFAGGVDRTRPIYASAPGTLWVGKNGHLSRGGDFEKRKAFALHGNLWNQDIIEYELDGVTKWTGKTLVGVVGTESGIVAYYNKTPLGSAPDGVQYVVLPHIFGVVFPPADANDPEITNINTQVDAALAEPGVTDFTLGQIGGVAREIVHSELYDGKIFIIVKYCSQIATLGDAVLYPPATDYYYIPFYDGQPVWDLIRGKRYAEYAWYSANPSPANVPARGMAGHLKQAFDEVSETWNVLVTRNANGTLTLDRPAVTVSTDQVIVTKKNAAGVVYSTVTTTYNASTTINIDVSLANVGDTLNVKMNSPTAPTRSYQHGLGAKPTTALNFAKTYKRKMYALSGSLIHFTGVDSPLHWDRDEDAGAGFINLSNHSGGSDILHSIEVYQDKLAIFSRRAVQIWYMDDTATANVNSQIISSTGTRSPKSAKSFGDLDVFYLADTGIRSLRARDSTNAASVNDVGTPIDVMIQDLVRSLTDAELKNVQAVIEPFDGRYMILIGGKIFVFSYFPSKRISGWSWYEHNLSIDQFFTAADRVYVRSGTKLYILGGEDNNTYGSDYEVEAHLPYISSGKPATYKQVTGVDIAATGTWDVSMSIDPRDVNNVVHCGSLDGVTYPDGNIGAVGHCTHIAPRLLHKGDGYASLSSVTVHFEGSNDE